MLAFVLGYLAATMCDVVTSTFAVTNSPPSVDPLPMFAFLLPLAI
jgi:hypothetical protein